MHPPSPIGLRTFLIFLFGLLFTANSFADHPSRPTPDDGPTVVDVHVFLVDLDGIDSAQQTFDGNIYIELSWFDPRLIDNKRTTTHEVEIEKIWQPRLLVVNQIFVRRSFPEFASVEPDGRVTYRQQFVGTFSQPLNLREFPFDAQRVTVQFASPMSRPDQVRFKVSDRGDHGVNESLSIPDWRKTGWDLDAGIFQPVKGTPPLPGFHFEVAVEREYQYYVIKVIIPLLLILVMACTVFWIHPTEGGVQIGVSTTAMLTLIAYRFAIGSDLPKIPYLTRLDIFILACTFLVVFCLIEVVFTSRLAAIDNLQRAMRIDRFMRVAFPLLVLAVGIYAFRLY